MCGFQSFERKFEIALAKPGKQAVQPAGELGVFLKADLLPEYFLRPDLLNPSVDNAKHLGLDETIELGCQLAVARRCNGKSPFLLALGNAQQFGANFCSFSSQFLPSRLPSSVASKVEIPRSKVAVFPGTGR